VQRAAWAWALTEQPEGGANTRVCAIEDGV
jgi:hypothetical protein